MSDERPTRGFWIGLALGTPIMVYGVAELIAQAGSARAFAVATWAGAGLLLHDLVFLPVVLAVTWILVRVVPSRLGRVVRVGVLATALLVALGWPGLRGYGNKPDNPTVHPLDYGTAVLTAVALAWVTLVGWCVWMWARPRVARDTE